MTRGLFPRGKFGFVLDVKGELDVTELKNVATGEVAEARHRNTVHGGAVCPSQMFEDIPAQERAQLDVDRCEFESTPQWNINIRALTQGQFSGFEMDRGVPCY